MKNTKQFLPIRQKNINAHAQINYTTTIVLYIFFQLQFRLKTRRVRKYKTYLQNYTRLY